jgi:peptide/nickel transport system substrate-binding protein
MINALKIDRRNFPLFLSNINYYPIHLKIIVYFYILNLFLNFKYFISIKKGGIFLKKVLMVFCLILFVSLTFALEKDVFVNLTGAGEVSSLDPHYAYDTASGEILNSIYDNLIMYDGESITNFLPMLSTVVPSIENGFLSPDGKVYTFPMREDVKFHSGNVLTPEDVEYSFERGLLYDPAAGPMIMLIQALTGGKYASLEAWFEAYSGMPYSEAVDENREVTSEDARQKLISFYEEVIDPKIVVDGNNVVFKLDSAYAPFLYIITHFAYWSAIIDSEACIEAGAWNWEADGWWKWHDLQPEETPLNVGDFGTGPFRFVEWDRTQQKVILERNDDYWREPAKLKTVIVENISEFSTRKSIIEREDADVAYFGASYLDQAEDLEAQGKVTLSYGYPRAAVTSLHFNWGVSEGSEYLGSGELDGKGIPADFFSDPDIRKGFSYCYDGATFIDEVLNGLGKLIPADLPEGFLGYDPTLPLPTFNLAKAAEHFKKAWNGEVWEKGFELQLLFNIGNDQRRTAMEMLAFYLSSLNPKFKVTALGVQWPTYLRASRASFLPVFTIGWNADYPDPDNFISTYYASYGVYSARQGQQFMDFARENTDALISAALLSTDANEREELYIEVQRIAIENTLGVTLYMPLGINVRGTWVRGWFPHPIRSGIYYYDLWKE